MPELGVAHEMQWPAAASGYEQPAVHQGVRVIAGKYDGAVRGDVFFSDNVDLPEERVRYDANEPPEDLFEQAAESPALCGQFCKNSRNVP